jgi:hypothetical protein
LIGGSIVAAAWQTYEQYTKAASDYCESNLRSWSGSNSLVSKIDYPALNSDTINTTMSDWRNNKQEWYIWSEKDRLQRDLSPTRIGEYTGFKTLEIARIGYRSKMNQLFACGVISSRIKTISELKDIIWKKIKTTDSEILKKIEKEWKDLKKQESTLKCKPEERTEKITDIINTATKQYCYYRYYLKYLDSNLNADMPNIQKIEEKVWIWSGTTIIKTTDQWSQIAPRYTNDLTREITRSSQTLPKAVRAFGEMDQTFGAHILLVFIYDDYVKLRKSLSHYMNLSSQLYQKANNAMSKNR